MTLQEWANRWALPVEALHELQHVMINQATQPHGTETSESTESAVQQQIRMAACKRGARLWRNNSGAVTTDDGRHVRFGLGNDSKRMNTVIKSSDLIGVTPVIITDDHIGRTFGVFTSIEVKHPGWQYKNTDRESAQLNWINAIKNLGGFASFATNPDIIDSIDK